MAETRTGRQLGGQFIAGDPLRALAALWIVTYHICSNALSRTGPQGFAVDMSSDLGEFGHVLSRALFSVFLFFGLSGYLLARPYLHSIILGTRTPRVRSYFRNRALRILPVFWIACIVTFIVFGKRGQGWSEVLAVPGFAQIYHPSHFSHAFPQAWTLDNEIIFYTLLPLAGWAGLRLIGGRWSAERRALAILAFLLATVAASITFRSHQTEWKWLIALPSLWFTFAAGISAACVEPLLRDRIQTPRAGRIAAWSVLAVGIAAFAKFVWAPGSIWAGGMEGYIATFCIILAPLILQWTTGSCWRFFDNGFFQWLGQRSYSFYIWHGLLIYAWKGPLPEYADKPGLTVLVLLVPVMLTAFAAAHLSFRLIEQPFLARKHLWRRGEETRPGREHSGEPVRGDTMHTPVDTAPAPAGAGSPDR
jgi:peptidoglycan/LPS O-acetylase OafA/YrhL